MAAGKEKGVSSASLAVAAHSSRGSNMRLHTAQPPLRLNFRTGSFGQARGMLSLKVYQAALAALLVEAKTRDLASASASLIANWTCDGMLIVLPEYAVGCCHGHRRRSMH